MRLLTEVEIARAAVLTSLDIPIGLLEVTATGISKSILDATESVRRFLEESGTHAYRSQQQGTAHKRMLPTKLLRADGTVLLTETSAYRPRTKNGDPRIWVYGLKDYVDPGDVIVLAILDGEFWVANLSNVKLDVLAEQYGPFEESIARAYASKTFVVDELTELLVEVNRRGFIMAPGRGDTMVGRVLETALGIEANSRRAPDFRGIELKAYRFRPGTRGHAMKRRNLFAKTPDWLASTLKSSREIVDAFGYDRAGVLTLNCEVRATRFNTQGLRLAVDDRASFVREQSNRSDLPEVAAWPLAELEAALAAKHKETFWIGAESRVVNGVESFKYVLVEHTQQPLVEQFGPLVQTGHVSLDHLIKRTATSAQERGPLFKLDNSVAELMFPSPRHFSLE